MLARSLHDPVGCVWLPAFQFESSTEVFSIFCVEFDDVIAEPEGTYSIDCVWRSSNRLFTCSKNCCYKTLTLICGLPIAFISGCTFACLSFQHIWCVSPALRQCRINCYMVRQYLTSCLDSCLGPCCSEMGLCLSRIRVGKYQLTSSEVV
ncbi:Caveolin-1 [Araneus ventricosus]|uniref:Caveolin n=1 Tax=Araneus ventricosus TaxID=182803 RepID=A0A4Y2GQZ4_ARAVE|nr:Caveolin-1 [Araneus ventricosus]